MRLVDVNDDLISRTALLNDLSYCAPELWQDEEYIKAKIMKQPTVDAVPVVRCKDCKYGVQKFNDLGEPFIKCCNQFIKNVPYRYLKNYCSEGKEEERGRMMDGGENDE